MKPAPLSIVIKIRATPKLESQLKRLAVKQKRTLSFLGREALERYVEEQKREMEKP